MTTRIAIDFSTEIDGLCRNCHGDHHIQACPQIARFDIETYLREQNLYLYNAIGSALACLRGDSLDMAIGLLEIALKGKPMPPPEPKPEPPKDNDPLPNDAPGGPNDSVPGDERD